MVRSFLVDRPFLFHAHLFLSITGHPTPQVSLPDPCFSFDCVLTEEISRNRLRRICPPPVAVDVLSLTQAIHEWSIRISCVSTLRSLHHAFVDPKFPYSTHDGFFRVCAFICFQELIQRVLEFERHYTVIITGRVFRSIKDGGMHLDL